MRISMSFSPEQVERLDEIMRNLTTRTFAGAQRLTELAADEHCQQLAAALNRAKQRAAGALPTRRCKRVSRATTDAIIVDFGAANLTVREIASKHNVSAFFVYSLARAQRLRRKRVIRSKRTHAEQVRARAEICSHVSEES